MTPAGDEGKADIPPLAYSAPARRAMSPPIQLRLLTRADLPFADSLRAQAGWNQTTADWERFLTAEPDGCFLAEWKGAPAGTATTFVYSPELAWIGMVLVHPEQRRRGIGNALLLRCVGYLQGRGVRCIKLDATALGQPVYERLGFQSEWSLTRWERSGPPETFPSDGWSVRLRHWREGDAGDVDRLDTAVFGVSRKRLLRELAKQSCAAQVVESEAGEPLGYGLMRAGARAYYLGPIVARTSEVPFPLIEALLTRCGAAAETKVFWDIPDQNLAAVAWARAHGFTPQRSLTRMYLGQNSAPGDSCLQFGISAPELG